MDREELLSDPRLKVRLWSKPCGKWMYLREDHAKEDLENMQGRWKERKSYRNRGLPRAVYTCPICGGFHITHQRQGRDKPKPRKKGRR